jgi:hypothetical protein
MLLLLLFFVVVVGGGGDDDDDDKNLVRKTKKIYIDRNESIKRHLPTL